MERAEVQVEENREERSNAKRSRKNRRPHRTEEG